jgi:hypothetical protein
MNQIVNQVELAVQQGFVHALKRKVIVNKEFIEFEVNDLENPDTCRIYWKDFKQIRYGVEMIKGYAFYIGRKHRIYIRDAHQNEIKINLISFYGIKRKQNHEDFCQLTNSIYDLFLKDSIYQRMDHVCNNGTETFEKVSINNSGIDFPYNKTMVSISWEEVVLREYHGYFFIQNKSQPEQAIKVSYLEDWNAVIIYSMIQSFLKMSAQAENTNH